MDETLREIMVCALKNSTRNLVLLALLFACAPFRIDAQTVADQEQGTATEAPSPGAIENLVNIQQSIDLKRSAVRDIKKQLKTLEDTADRQEFEQKIERIKNEIAGLQVSFEQIVLGGINLSILTDQPEEQINWQDEVEKIVRPLLSMLKELTARPRQIDRLRREIEMREDQLRAIEKALESIRLFEKQALAPVAGGAIRQMLADWEQRREDSKRELEIASFNLTTMTDESIPWQISVGEAFSNFFRGRGLTLLIATVIAVAIWGIAKGLLAMYWRLLYRSRYDIGITRAPLVLYSYRLVTAILIVLAILMVLYVRGDVLLLTLAVIALAGAALSLRQTLPRYAAELRLLFGVGPVREEERLVLDGIPFTVESLGVYSVLRNPTLEGVMRLPLRAMNELVSRPAGEEPWFPCQPGDYLLLANGSFGRVLRQTIEVVELAVRDSIVQIRTKDFLSQHIQNLSRDGFGIASTFGIDYQHQGICLDTVPGRFQKSIKARFEKADLKDDIEQLLVSFKEAGASSLDYQIYIVLKGRAANAFFKAQRLVQQACVETCNREGWVIPFTQITVHSKDVVDSALQPTEQTTGDPDGAEVALPPNQ
jgi:small-conductance mechanosensitive channel